MASNAEKGEYVPVPQNDVEDVLQVKKVVATGSPSSLPDISAKQAAWMPVVAYCVASITMTVVNKYCVSGRNFTMNFLLLTIQSTVCVVCVSIAKKLGVISFREFDSADAKKWFPISFLLVSVIYTGSKSLQYLSIPVYTIFKNLTIILIAYGEVLWFGGRVTSITLGSFGLMVLSSIIAAWSDISHGLGSIPTSWSNYSNISSSSVAVVALTKHVGYAWMLLNGLTTAAFALSMRKRIKVTGFSDWDTMFYNNLLSVPVLAIFSFIVEDWGTANLNLNFPADTRVVLLSAIAFSGAAAVGISYTTAWCMRATSSTTYSMVGALNKLPIALSGLVFFGDPATLGSVSAIGVGFLAGLVYAFAKNKQKKEDQNSIPMHTIRRS